MTQNQGKPLSPMMKGCLFLVLHPIWIGLLIAGLYVAFNSGRLVVSGVEVDAVMVDTDFHNGSDGRTTLSPIFEYTYEGQTYRYNSINASSELPYKLGDHVTLLIDPHDPEYARVKSFDELWFLPTIFLPVSLCMGAVMIALGSLASRFGRVTSMGNVQVNM